jgi:pimeloyl-ACP methyl ester carboxylesterase
MAEIYKTEDGRRAVEERYREFLSRWPVPAEHLHVPTTQGETFVIACGPSDAPPLVLLHGSLANSAMWLTDVADYARHFRMYAIDLIGEPGLSAPSRPPMTSDAYARWLEEVLDALDIQRTRMVAVSLGGWMALDYATRHPDKVERLALQCPSGIGPQLWGKLMVAMLLKPFGRWGRTKAIRLLLGPPPPSPQPLLPASPQFLPSRHLPSPLPQLPASPPPPLLALHLPAPAPRLPTLHPAQPQTAPPIPLPPTKPGPRPNLGLLLRWCMSPDLRLGLLPSLESGRLHPVGLPLRPGTSPGLCLDPLPPPWPGPLHLGMRLPRQLDTPPGPCLNPFRASEQSPLLSPDPPQPPLRPETSLTSCS